MQRTTLVRVGLVAGACALVGAAGGIAGSAAAPSKSSQTQTTTNGAPDRDHDGWGHRGFGFGFGPGGPAVHAELVVPNQAGNGFETVTVDEGTLKSVSGNQITITEGTQSATYKDVTLTIPSGAKVLRNFNTAQLSDLQQGDRVRVSSSPEETGVFAADANHQGPPKGMGGPHGPGAPPYGAPPGP